MRKVLLIGFRAEHVAKIKKEYAKVFKISALTDQNTKHSSIILNANNFENIVVATKFTSHAIHKKCRKNKGYIMMSGGFSSLKPILNNIL